MTTPKIRITQPSTVFVNRDNLAPSHDAGGDQVDEKGELWDIHLFSKQVVLRGSLFATFFEKAAQDYDVKMAVYIEDPSNDTFTGLGKGPYDAGTRLGRVMRYIFLPERFRKGSLSEAEVEELRALGGWHGKLGSAIMIGGNAFNAVVNAYGLGKCIAEGKCSETDIKVMLSEVLTSHTFLWFQYLNGRSSEIIEKSALLAAKGNTGAAKEGMALAGKLGLAGRGIGFAAFGFKIYGGFSKFEREWENYKRDPASTDKLAMLDGALDIGDGISSALVNGYFIGQYLGARAATASFVAVKRATDIVSVGATRLPLGLLIVNVAFRAASAAPGMVTASMSFISDASNDNLSADEKNHSFISNGLLFNSSLAFFVSAFCIASPFAFAGYLLMGIGFALFAAKTLNDNADRWF